MGVGLQKLAFLSHTEMVINPLDSSASWRFSCKGRLLDIGSHLLLQDSHSCAIDGYDKLVFILRVATKLGQQQCGDASVPLIASSWFLMLSVC